MSHADSINKWEAGPHYGPVLTPTDLYILDCNLAIHPILESKDGEFNLLFNLCTGQTGGFNPDDRNRDLPFTQKDEPATLPRMTEIVLITKQSPWCTIVRNERGVTLADVCTHLWKEYTENPITESEFGQLPPRYQELVRRTAAGNQQAGVGMYGGMQGRLRRCDWLRDKTWFDILYVDERYSQERLGFHAANIFVMTLTS